MRVPRQANVQAVREVSRLVKNTFITTKQTQSGLACFALRSQDNVLSESLNRGISLPDLQSTIEHNDYLLTAEQIK